MYSYINMTTKAAVLFVESQERDREGPHFEFEWIRGGGYK